MMKVSPTCRQAYKQICAGIGEELDSPECRAIRAHIRSCRKCSSTLKNLRKTIDLYKIYPTPRHTPLRLKSSRSGKS